MPDPIWETELQADCPEKAITGPVADLRRDLNDLDPTVEMWFRRQHKPLPRINLRLHLRRPTSETGRQPRLPERLSSMLSERGWPAVDPAAACRSAAVFGGEPFLSHDGYIARFVLYLARTSDVVMELLATVGAGAAQRQKILFRALAQGLAAAGMASGGEPRRAAYLRFHRDWLVRFPILARAGESVAGRQVVDRFEQRAAAMAPALESLRSLLTTVATDRVEEPGALPAWRVTLGELVAMVRELTREPRFHIDSFASDPLFPALFKAHHNLANQLGFDLLQEAFTHHLLLRAVAPAMAAEPVALTWDEA